jgi:hypothetical protein
MLESNPSAGAGGMTEGRGCYGPASFLPPLLIPRKAINSNPSIGTDFPSGFQALSFEYGD